MRVVGLACLLLAATACAPAAKPIVLNPPPAADSSSNVEGRYRGTVRLVRAAGAFCPRSGARVLAISGNALSLSYSAAPRQRVSLTAAIDADGRIQASDGVGSIEGQIADGKLEVTVASDQCEHRWTLVRVD